MSHQNVFSQMFDVRPRLNGGDLDLEKIKQIQALLNLRPGEGISERVIDLKPKRKSVFFEPEMIKSKNNPLSSPGLKVKSDIELDNTRDFHFWPSFSEIESPSRADILSVLEIIEATEQILKKSNNKAPERIISEDTEPAELKPLLFAEEEPGEPLEIAQVIEPEGTQEENLFVDAEGQDDELSANADDSEPTNSFDDLMLLPYEPENAGEPSQEFNDYHSVAADSLADSFWLKVKPDNSEIRRAGKNEYSLMPPELGIGTLNSGWQAKKLLRPKPVLAFLVAAMVIFSLVPLAGLFSKATTIKDGILNSSLSAYQAMNAAKDRMSGADFSGAEQKFSEANIYFASANSQINSFGGWLVPLLDKIPGLSYFSSRIRLVETGQQLSEAGQNFTQMIGIFKNSSLNLGGASDNVPLTSLIEKAGNYLRSGAQALAGAQQNLNQINISSLPADVQPQLLSLQAQLPRFAETAAGALDWTDKILAILGQQNAKKYLLVFQNNAEIRATGGFIGTYGILNLDHGQIKNLFVDGIFNPDGQLSINIVPPAPIQKISTAWSTHDANWFADFPTSAKKIMWFYEKTGGATMDGVISLTPTVVEKLLQLTGPIEMPEYGVTLDDKNFVDLTQEEVEVKYDKQLNQPKKILADFVPKFMAKLDEIAKKDNIAILQVLNECLKEKQIMLYFADPDLEKFAQDQGWAGELKVAKQDYFSVVNENIDGKKTDRVIIEQISHESQIQADGSIIDTLTVTRHHQGGNSQYAWYNAVNADYLRVYLPLSSELISAQGQTRETDKPPIDYAAAGFKTDSDVIAEEQNMHIDQNSGTQIFEESGKTVFGNWVYVSPGQTTTLVYQYRLPFKFDVSKPGNFELLAQKQSGSFGSGLEAKISLPTNCSAIGDNAINTDLSVDRSMNFNLQCY